MKIADLRTLVKRAISEWMDDDAPTLAAALSYYTVFSIAPLLIISVAVAAFIFGDQAARGEVHQELAKLVGLNGAKAIEDMMASASKPGAGALSTSIGFVVLLLGASGVFAQLQQTMNKVWKTKPPKISGIINFIRVRFLSFGMVLAIGFLLLVSLLLSAAVAAVGTYFAHLLPGGEAIWHLINSAISFAVVTLLFALIYKVLPDTRVVWRDIWLGAAVTALLFTIGKLMIGLYLGKTGVVSSYGAAGSVIVLFIWVNYSAQILILGAEITQVYSKWRQQRHRHELDRRIESDPPPSTWLPSH
jgi:membrane protein